MVDQTPEGARIDPESAEWLRALAGSGPHREAVLERLHELLVQVARKELERRGPRLPFNCPELGDLAHRAADDALTVITGKIGQFQGESRFRTWACKFVILEVSAKIGQHFWRHPAMPRAAGNWDRLPGLFGFEPGQGQDWRNLLAELRRAVEQELSPRQREVFVAIVLDGVPLDALVNELVSTRNAIYKTLFDARDKLRAALAEGGYLGQGTSSWRS